MMSDYLFRWIEFSQQHPWLSIALTTCLHLVVLVLSGGIVARLMHWHSASARHLTWASVIVGALLLLPARHWVPALAVPFAVPSPSLIVPDAPFPSDARQLNDANAEIPRLAAMAEAHGIVDLSSSRKAHHLESAASELTVEPYTPGSEKIDRAVATSAVRIEMIPVLILSCLYIMGVFLCACRAWLGWTRLRRTTREGQVLSTRGCDLVRECAKKIGLSQIPNCVTTHGVSVPMTWGTWRPNVLLPDGFESLNASQQRNCLLHEMAHVSRRDSIWSWLSFFATSLYWFHPAIHVAAFNLKRAREDATDDLVLQSGVDSSQYASTLLELTANGTNCTPLPAVAMASTIPFESRLRRILDCQVHRRLPSPALRVAVGMIFLMLTAVGFRFSSVVAQQPQSGAQKVANERKPAKNDSLAGATFYERLKSVTLAEGDPEGVIFTVRGTVLDSDGDPVVGAIVVLREDSTNRFSTIAARRPITSRDPIYVDDVFARTRTGEDGSYEFTSVPAPTVGERYRDRWSWAVVASNEAGRVGWNEIQRKYVSPVALDIESNIVLRRSSAISGRLLSTEGKPVEGVIVKLGSLERVDPAPTYLASEDRLNLNASSLQPSVTSGPDGSFLFPAVPSELTAALSLQHAEHTFPYYRIASASTAAAQPNDKNAAFGQERLPPLLASPATIKAVPRLIIRGKLRTEPGQPLAGIQVSVGSTSSYAETDQQGMFEWPTTELALRRHMVQPHDGKDAVRFSAVIPNGNYLPIATYEPLENILAFKEVELVAREGVVVEGKVVCRQDDAPIAGVTVALQPSNDSELARLQLRTTDVDGIFKFVAPKEAVAIGISGTLGGYNLPARNWPLNQQPASEFIQQLDLGNPSPAVLQTFKVDRVNQLNVRVVDGEGQTIEGAVVTAFHMVSLSPKIPMKTQASLSAPSRTDNEGTCPLDPTADHWEGGEVRAQKEIDGVTWYGSQSAVSGVVAPITVTLKKAWRITGRVSVDGKPAPNIQVMLARRLNTGGNAFGMSTSKHAGIATTDIKGEYEFSAAPNESYSVSVIQSPVDGQRSARGLIPKLISDGKLRVPDFDYTSETQSLSLGTIAGTVRDLNRIPIVGARVHFYQYVGPRKDRSVVNVNRVEQVETDAEGRFMLKGLRAGRARLHVYPNETKQSSLVATYVVATVGDEDVQVVMDHRLNLELPRVEPKRVVSADSVPKLDR